MKKYYLLALLFVTIFLAGCAHQSDVVKNQNTNQVVGVNQNTNQAVENNQDINQAVETNQNTNTNSTPALPVSGWRGIELTDINSGISFKISDYASKPILLESFAVWCPTCLRQQKEIKKLHEIVGDSVISISIDTDPNEDATEVREHTDRNSLNWLFVVAPIDFTQSLIDQFGFTVVNAPSAPVVLICPGGEAKLLGRGVKSAIELQNTINNDC